MEEDTNSIANYWNNAELRIRMLKSFTQESVSKPVKVLQETSL